MKKYKLGIFGSATDNSPEIIVKATELGRVLATYKNDMILITGAATGLPGLISKIAASKGVELWGYSPAYDSKEQQEFAPDEDQALYTKLIFVPKEFQYSDSVRRKYRNVLSTANCDAGIIISGRWGTLNEFTNLTDMGKTVGVLTGTGGIADEIERLTNIIQKPKTGKVLFSDSPEELVKKVLSEF